MNAEQTTDTAAGGEPADIHALVAEVDRLTRVDAREALRVARRARHLASACGDAALEAYALRSLAHAWRVLSQHHRALQFYDDVRRRFSELGMAVEAARTEIGRIDSLMYLGHYDEALAASTAARRTFVRHGERMRAMRLDLNTGNIYHRLDRHREALRCYDRARRAAGVDQDAFALTLIDYNRANVLTMLSRHAAAESIYESVLETCAQHGFERIVAHVQYNFGYLRFLQGRYDDALELFEAARTRFAAEGDARFVGSCDLDAGEVLVELNQTPEAWRLARGAERVFAHHAMRSERSRALWLSGVAAGRLGRRRDAMRDLAAARRAFAAEGNASWVGMAELARAMLHLRAGRRRLAGRLAHAASTVFEEHGLALRRAQAQLVEARAALDAGDAGRARSLARQARRAVRGLRVPWLEYQWHHLGARVHEAAGHRGPALTAYRRAMAALERVRSGLQVDERKIGLLADKLEVFEDAVRAALGGEQPRFDLAFEFIEQAKSRVLLDALRARAGRSRDRRPTRAERLEREILGLYNTVNATGRSDRREAGVARRAMVRRVARLERELDRLEARRSRSPASGPGGLRLATLARSLDPDQTLIEFFGQRDRIGALVVRRDGVEHHASVVTLEAAQTMLDRLRLLVGKSPAPAGVNGDRERLLLEATGEILEQLGASLTPLLPAPSSLPPSADQAPRPPARLLFIPHGPLHYLPLHAASRDGVPLAETFEIAYAPSAAIWCMASPHAASRRASTAPLPRYDVDRWSRPGDGADVLLVGPIDDRLPGAMAEIELLHARHPAARVLTREAATRDAVIEALGACRLVHVATHCMLHPERPELSGLELADGWLRVPDLAALDLDVDLVTLSACATGPGRVRSGDEMSGLLRGFLMAGARQVLASLWPVRDAETTAFMGHLAAELAAERAPSRETRRKRGAGTDDRHAIRRAVGTAVRSATLAMRRQYPHPSLWAPFVLYERRDPRLRVHAATC